MKAYLPRSFSFSNAKDLVRVGRDYDGGYLVSNRDIERSDLLIGFGISDDWSFEIDFANRNDVDIIAYDASLTFRFWAKRVIDETIKNPFSFYALKKYISYKNL